MSYKIICTKGNWLAACGFYSLDRANKWIENFNPNLYMDKTLTKQDFIIKEEQ